MEQQMEILRLERELEKKREALFTNRKQEYSRGTGPENTPSQKPLPTKKQVC